MGVVEEMGVNGRACRREIRGAGNSDTMDASNRNLSKPRNNSEQCHTPPMVPPLPLKMTDILGAGFFE